MILVDTSVWIDHFRSGDPVLTGLLNAGRVLTHPFVIGELALGNLRQRDAILGALRDLPQAVVAGVDDILPFIAQQALFGSGIGYIDVHLLAAARLTPGATIWTGDRRLRAVADSLSLSALIAN